MRKVWIVIMVFGFVACNETDKNSEQIVADAVQPMALELNHAQQLIELPLTCIDTEYPNKLSQVIGDDEDLGSPKELHPAFYGCFDWHSAVHGHWSIVRMYNGCQNLEDKDVNIKKLLDHISVAKIEAEIEYFEGELNGSYERMYGWAWLLKLAEELESLEHSNQKELSQNLAPLCDLIVEKIKEFLPKLNYPIRVGTHTNTAFAMTMIYDYSVALKDAELQLLVEERARDFFMNDINCPMSWEPSGYDFLSPCLEEADIMRRVLSKEEFKEWIVNFLPELQGENYSLEPGEVSDRSDGHLVHLDGLNFSRAWCLYGIAETLPEDYGHLISIANEHIKHSLPNLVGDSYEGGHWLASFSLLALRIQD